MVMSGQGNIELQEKIGQEWLCPFEFLPGTNQHQQGELSLSMHLHLHMGLECGLLSTLHSTLAAKHFKLTKELADL